MAKNDGLALLDEAHKAEFDKIDAICGADGKVSRDEWVQGLLKAEEYLTDDQFEMEIKKLTR